MFQGKSSNLTSLSSMSIWWLPTLTKLAPNQSFLMPKYILKMDFSVEFQRKVLRKRQRFYVFSSPYQHEEMEMAVLVFFILYLNSVRPVDNTAHQKIFRVFLAIYWRKRSSKWIFSLIYWKFSITWRVFQKKISTAHQCKKKKGRMDFIN